MSSWAGAGDCCGSVSCRRQIIDNKQTCINPDIGVLLPAYELGALLEHDVRRFELHLMQCKHCLDSIKELEPYLPILKHDQQVQSEVRQLLDQKRDRREVKYGVRDYLWPDFPWLFRPAIVYLFLLVVIIAAGLTFIPSNNIEIIPVQHITLMPMRSATDKALSPNQGQYGIISFIYQDAQPGKEYCFEIRKDNSKVVLTHKLFRFDAAGWAHLQIPVSKMKPGRYQLIILDPQESSDISLLIYNFTVTEHE